MQKQYVSAQMLLEVSFELAIQIYNSGFRPNYIVAIWRGGTPVGIAVQELLKYLQVESDHISIRTSSYIGIGQRSKQVTVHGLHYIIENVNSEDSLLIVDDVYDTGLSIRQVISEIETACRKNTPLIKVATPYFKPGKNQTDRVPDYCIHQTEDWLIFPHELEGLTEQEIAEYKPGLAKLLSGIRTAQSE